MKVYMHTSAMKSSNGGARRVLNVQSEGRSFESGPFARSERTLSYKSSATYAYRSRNQRVQSSRRILKARLLGASGQVHADDTLVP